MKTFTQINKLAIQCQDIVAGYNKDAAKYGIDKVEMKSTEYYELLITAMLSAGATINDIKVNHVQIALGRFPEDDSGETLTVKKVNHVQIALGKFLEDDSVENGDNETIILDSGETLTVKKVSFDNYSVFKGENVFKEWLSKKELKEELSNLKILSYQ